MAVTLIKALLHRVGLFAAHYLMAEVERNPLIPTTEISELARILRRGDVLLIEGCARVSAPIRYLTQSTWSHAALYVGPIDGRKEADGEPHVLIEADLIEGVHSSPLSRYQRDHTRICRPLNVSDDDLAALAAFAVDRIGYKYDLHNLFDLIRYVLPTPPLPERLRRRYLSVGAHAPTRAICSTLIAQAFQSIHYPILPIVEIVEDAQAAGPTRRHIIHEILHIRDSALFVPRDFDISPYFAVIKPAIVNGFDYRQLTWI
jgi:hypothetical protein